MAEPEVTPPAPLPEPKTIELQAGDKLLVIVGGTVFRLWVAAENELTVGLRGLRLKSYRTGPSIITIGAGEPAEYVECPECGSPMELKLTHKYTYTNGAPRKFYGCTQFPACNGTHGAHPDGKPMGIPANKETKLARSQAHIVFDARVKAKGLSRRDGYAYLQKLMGMAEPDAHIANFDKPTCELLVQKINADIAAEKAEQPAA